MTRWCSVAIALAAAAALSCAQREVDLAAEPSDGDAGTLGRAIPGLQSLRITPGAREATFDGSALDERPVFRAIGSFSSGERDVSGLVEWSLARPELGTIERGRFDSAAIGGETEVRASAGNLTTTASLRIKLDVAIDRDLGNDLIEVFAADPTGDRTGGAPRLAYPSAGAVVPNNLANLRYQWRAPDAFDAFELAIDSDDARLRYYTRKRFWLDDATTSRFFAPSHPGAGVRIRVRAIASAARTVVHRSEDVTLEVAEASLPGQALYWSSTARGIKRGELGSSHAARIVTAPGGPAGATCTGCHVLSRDGKLLAVVDEDERLGLFTAPDWTPRPFRESTMPGMPMDLPPGMPPTGKGGKAMMPTEPAAPAPPPMAAGMAEMPEPPRGPADYGFGSFNPDGSQLAYASKGKLHIVDTATGRELPKTRLPPDTSIAHPDWSPDGSFIAVAYAMGKAPKSEKLVTGSGIARLPVLPDGTIGEPVRLVESIGSDDTLAFPAVAPDGRWIAYARATGPSKDNPTAQLWIVAADGGSPLLLERANRPAGAEALSPPAAANNMPTWGLASGTEQAFLVFSSTRDYGDALVGLQRDQLWATALDLERLAEGADPSAPAFWLPFQDPSEHNHRAFWSVPATGCVGRAEVCDERDDDCDGEVDEACCRVGIEICGDGTDNDCDGVADEGCGCEDSEICGNDLDEDCDQNVDENCKVD